MVVHNGHMGVRHSEHMEEKGYVTCKWKGDDL